MGTLEFSDPDGDTLTITISGVDADKFVYDEDTKEVRLAPGLSTDSSKQSSYKIVITAVDSGGLSVVKE